MIDKSDVHDLPEWGEHAAAVEAAVDASKVIAAVIDDVTLAKANEALAVIVKARKGADEARKAVGKPHRDALAVINAEFGELVSPLGGAEEALKAQVAGYHRKRQAEIAAAQREREAEAKRIEEEHRKAEEARAFARRMRGEGEGGVPTPAPAPPPIVSSPATTAATAGGGSVGVRKVWKFEVTDPEKVPRGFLIVDQKAIGEAVRGGLRELEGVRIYADDVVAVRS